MRSPFTTSKPRIKQERHVRYGRVISPSQFISSVAYGELLSRELFPVTFSVTLLMCYYGPLSLNKIGILVNVLL